MNAPLQDKDSIGQTALHYAVCNPHAPLLISHLTKAGINLDVQRSTDQWTALHLAVMVGNAEVVKLLYQAGADLDKFDIKGMSPKDLARHYRFFHIYDILNRSINSLI